MQLFPVHSDVILSLPCFVWQQVVLIVVQRGGSSRHAGHVPCDSQACVSCLGTLSKLLAMQLGILSDELSASLIAA